jgi:hypothetical protein
MWSTQGFVVFILLHLVSVFCTMGYRGPRRVTWILGVIMFLLVLVETEFGYALRGDFSSQWRALQGADLYNGAGIGWWINPLNEIRILGIHTAIIPLIVLAILVVHYALVRFLGIARPAQPDVPYTMVKANHTVLFARGLAVIVVIVVLAILLPSPYLKAVTLQEVAKSDPKLFAQTLVGEYGRLEQIGEDPDARTLTSGYSDTIQPYTFDTRKLYVEDPYSHLLASGTLTDQLSPVSRLSEGEQKKLVGEAIDFFGENKGNVKESGNALISVAKQLTALAATGYYDSALKGAGEIGDNTYHLRLIADLGVLDDQAEKLRMQTEQWGMLREEAPGRPGAWWLAPIGVLNHTVLAKDENGDRDGAIILGILVLILLAVPFIPGLNRLPVLLWLYKPFQRKPRGK